MAQKAKVLSYLNMSDSYERTARFAPSFIAACTFAPGAMAMALPVFGWISTLVTGVGATAFASLGMSHLASAMGNRFQRKLFPDWPFDSPTNRRLSPYDSTCSREQKQQWYETIKSITGLSIPEAPGDGPKEVNHRINDAVTAVRSALWKHPRADRLHTHNTEYGFARNFAGLAPVWLTLSGVSSAICWGSLFTETGRLGWAVLSTLLFLGLCLLHRFVMADYVKARAEHYADSFFNALALLDADSSNDRATCQHDEAPSTTE